MDDGGHLIRETALKVAIRTKKWGVAGALLLRGARSLKMDERLLLGGSEDVIDIDCETKRAGDLAREMGEDAAAEVLDAWEDMGRGR